jgi:hypothetical protein
MGECGKDEDGVEVRCAYCGCRHEPYEGYESKLAREKADGKGRGYARNYVVDEESDHS